MKRFVPSRLSGDNKITQVDVGGSANVSLSFTTLSSSRLSGFGNLFVCLLYAQGGVVASRLSGDNQITQVEVGGGSANVSSSFTCRLSGFGNLFVCLLYAQGGVALNFVIDPSPLCQVMPHNNCV